MQEPMSSPSTPEPRALRILAKSVFRELKTTGYTRSDIVSFATEMLSLVSGDFRDSDLRDSDLRDGDDLRDSDPNALDEGAIDEEP
jgi:hypothetical protein